MPARVHFLPTRVRKGSTSPTPKPNQNVIILAKELHEFDLNPGKKQGVEVLLPSGALIFLEVCRNGLGTLYDHQWNP